MTDEEFKSLVKQKFNETVDSIQTFVDHVCSEKITYYASNEFLLAHDIKMAIMFYKAREDAENRKES